MASGVKARQRSRYLRFSRPPQEKQLLDARKHVIKERKALNILKDSVFSTFVLSLLVLIAFNKDTRAPFLLKTSIETSLNGSDVSPVAFTKLRSINQWWYWSKTHLLSTLFTDEVTGKESYRPQIAHAHLIGQVLIRQLRVGNRACDVNIPTVLTKCRPGYNPSSASNETFGPRGEFSYSSSFSTHAQSYWGKMAAYEGGGHVIRLPNNKSAALILLDEAERNEWVNVHTRALFVQMTLFHAPFSLFA